MSIGNVKVSNVVLVVTTLTSLPFPTPAMPVKRMLWPIISVVTEGAVQVVVKPFRVKSDVAVAVGALPGYSKMYNLSLYSWLPPEVNLISTTIDVPAAGSTISIVISLLQVIPSQVGSVITWAYWSPPFDILNFQDEASTVKLRPFGSSGSSKDNVTISLRTPVTIRISDDGVNTTLVGPAKAFGIAGPIVTAKRIIVKSPRESFLFFITTHRP